jgi:hypothetical protein
VLRAHSLRRRPLDRVGVTVDSRAISTGRVHAGRSKGTGSWTFR